MRKKTERQKRTRKETHGRTQTHWEPPEWAKSWDCSCIYRGIGNATAACHSQPRLVIVRNLWRVGRASISGRWMWWNLSPFHPQTIGWLPAATARSLFFVSTNFPPYFFNPPGFNGLQRNSPLGGRRCFSLAFFFLPFFYSIWTFRFDLVESCCAWFR